MIFKFILVCGQKNNLFVFQHSNSASEFKMEHSKFMAGNWNAQNNKRNFRFLKLWTHEVIYSAVIRLHFKWLYAQYWLKNFQCMYCIVVEQLNKL